jgi:hypothetical protein
MLIVTWRPRTSFLSFQCSGRRRQHRSAEEGTPVRNRTSWLTTARSVIYFSTRLLVIENRTDVRSVT